MAEMELTPVSHIKPQQTSSAGLRLTVATDPLDRRRRRPGAGVVASDHQMSLLFPGESVDTLICLTTITLQQTVGHLPDNTQRKGKPQCDNVKEAFRSLGAQKILNII